MEEKLQIYKNHDLSSKLMKLGYESEFETI